MELYTLVLVPSTYSRSHELYDPAVQTERKYVTLPQGLQQLFEAGYDLDVRVKGTGIVTTGDAVIYHFVRYNAEEKARQLQEKIDKASGMDRDIILDVVDCTHAQVKDYVAKGYTCPEDKVYAKDLAVCFLFGKRPKPAPAAEPAVAAALNTPEKAEIYQEPKP